MLANLTTVLKGYRTYLAAAAAIATAIATVFGQLDPVHGAAIAASALAFAQIFQRAAAADHQLSLEEVATDVADFKNALKPLMKIAALNQPALAQGNGAAQPVGVLSNGSQQG